MKLILVSDIFGLTPALMSIKDELSKTVTDTGIIDPYNGTLHHFGSQADAYHYFTRTTGIERYQSLLESRLNTFDSEIVLIGFSVGAAAVWGMSNQPPFKHITKAICFYGSQIRHKTAVQPRFEVELIFPEKEPHFDVDRLMHRLKDKPQVVCKKAKGMHGFMNPLSEGYDPDCYLHCMIKLKLTLEEFKHKKSKSV